MVILPSVTSEARHGCVVSSWQAQYRSWPYSGRRRGSNERKTFSMSRRFLHRITSDRGEIRSLFPRLLGKATP
jgi:hypothetical protein